MKVGGDGDGDGVVPCTKSPGGSAGDVGSSSGLSDVDVRGAVDATDSPVFESPDCVAGGAIETGGRTPNAVTSRSIAW